MRKGVTVVELLIVLAIIGILLAIGIPNYSNWRATQLIREAQAVIEAQVTRTRTEAKRLNTSQEVTWTGSTFAGATLPAGVTITTTPGFLGFQAPYAVATYSATARSAADILEDEPLDLLQIALSGQGGRSSSVNIVGIQGKVIRQPVN